MANPSRRTPSCPSGLITTTFHLPVSRPDRSSVQASCVDRRTVTFVATISANPVRFSFTTGATVVLKLLPSRFVDPGQLVVLQSLSREMIPGDLMVAAAAQVTVKFPANLPGVPPGIRNRLIEYSPAVAAVRLNTALS